MSQPTHAQLIEARQTLERQIEIMRHPSALGPYELRLAPDNRELIAKLEAELAAANAPLASREQYEP
jgi:hypothetical protein